MNAKLVKTERKIELYRSAFRKSVLFATSSAVVALIALTPVTLMFMDPITPMIVVCFALMAFGAVNAVYCAVTASAFRKKLRKLERKRTWLREVAALDEQFDRS